MTNVINAYSYNSDRQEFEENISDLWEQNYDLTNVEYGDGVWFGTFGEDNGRSAFSLNSNLDNFTQQISDQWDQNYELTDVGYGDGVWFGVFNDEVIPGRNGYSYNSNLDSFGDAIAERWDQGFSLVDVEYGDGVWFGVFNENTDINGYSYNSNFDDFTQQISDRWDQNYELIDVEYGDGIWFGVFGEDTPGRNAYSSRSNLADFEQVISDRWDQGFELIDTAFGNGTWFGVFQERADDAYEQNNIRLNAYDLSTQEQTWLSSINGLGIQSDDDWYKIEVDSGYENVIANLQFTDADGDIDLALYDANGNFVTSSTSVSNNESIDTIVPNPGTYYLKVYYDNEGNSYDLWWDDVEVNTPSSDPTVPNPPTNPPIPANPPISNFQIDLNFIDSNITASQQAIFTQAANRWSEIILGDLPDEFVPGFGLVDDVAIDVNIVPIDGLGNTLGQAGPTQLRSGSSLPSRGFMQFDITDIENLEDEGDLEAVILHEIGHVLGVGTLWNRLDLLDTSDINDPRFTGTLATAEYNSIFGLNETSVPVEAEGGPGTALAHWREDVFDNEAMTGFLNGGSANPLSRMTIASLADMGYVVNVDAADVYTPPSSLTDASLAFEETVTLDLTPSITALSVPELTEFMTSVMGRSPNSVTGDDDNDRLIGTTGNDVIEGLAGDDVLYGDSDLFSPNAGLPSLNLQQTLVIEGSDVLVGGKGSDRLYGQQGNDILLGETGDDVLEGGSGNDLLFGGQGDDQLTGDSRTSGKGSDLFILATGFGTDTITDFEIGRDRIGLVGDLTFADLTINQVGTDTTISLDNDVLLVLNQVNSSELTEADFIANFVPNVYSGRDGHHQFEIAAGNGMYTISEFGAVGSEASPSQEIVEEVDSLAFLGDGLTADKMLLNQNGSDLEITFEGVENTGAILRNVALEDFDNLPHQTGAWGQLGNVMFAQQDTVTDSFDVFDASSTQSQVWNRNTTTFLNNLDNQVQGFSRSDDVINGQGGDDQLSGLGGDDLLRGGDGSDTLVGGWGNDTLVGGHGADSFRFDFKDGSVDTLGDFDPTQGDCIHLSANGFGHDLVVGDLSEEQFTLGSAATRESDRLIYNDATGALFYDSDGVGSSAQVQIAQLSGAPTLSHTDIAVMR